MLLWSAGAAGLAAGVAVGGSLTGGKRAGYALGGALGAAVTLAVAQRLSQPANDSSEPSFEQVARDDAIFRQKGFEEGFDEAAEALALRRLLEGESLTAVSAACKAPSMLEGAKAAYAPWRGSSASELGAALHKTVMVDLEAPHLKPSGIEERLLGGLDAAVFGLWSLMKQLPPPAAP